MNIQAISFGANQKQLKTKPYISPDKMQASSITPETAFKQIEEKQLASMAQQAKQAQNTASTIQENWGYVGRSLAEKNLITFFCYESKPEIDLTVNI